MKRILSRTICLLLLITMILPVAFATEHNMIQPRYTYVRMLNAHIDITGSTATIAANFSTYTSYDLKLACKLQHKVGSTWKDVQIWSKESSNISHISLTKEYPISVGEQYRLIVYGYVYNENSMIEYVHTTAT